MPKRIMVALEQPHTSTPKIAIRQVDLAVQALCQIHATVQSGTLATDRRIGGGAAGMISHLPLGFRPYTLPVCLCGEWPAPGRIQATHYDASKTT